MRSFNLAMAVECRLVALLVIEYLVVVSYLYVLLSQTLPLPSPNMVATGDGLDWWLLARLPRSACFGRPWLFTQGVFPILMCYCFVVL